jgi:hypothetical protein
MNNLKLKIWIENFNNGKYDNDFLEAGWYDWFCQDRYLNSKTKKMGQTIKQIKSENLLNNHYVFFKNNCPVVGGLYDDFRICNLETGDVIFNINVDNKKEGFKYKLYDFSEKGNSKEIGFNKRKDLLKYLNER